MDKSVTTIQRLYRKKLFLRSYNVCKTIFTKLLSFKTQKLQADPMAIHEPDRLFGLLTKQISNKDTLSNISNMLSKYYTLICLNDPIYYTTIAPKLDSRKLLSSYVLSIFPEFSLNGSVNEISKHKHTITYDIYILATDLIETLDKITKIDGPTNQDLTTLTKSINSYSNAFKSFITKDKADKINELVVRWYGLEKTKEEINSSEKYSQDQSSSVLKHLNDEQLSTINFIKKIDPKFDMITLNQYKTFVDRFDETMRRCYWDMLEKDIIDQKYILLAQSLNDIKNELVILHKESKKELDEFLDVDFIKHKLDHNVMHFNDFIGLSTNIIDRIIYLQAPARNENTAINWGKIRSKAETNIESATAETYGAIYAGCVKETIRFIMERIQEIKDDIIAVKVMIDLCD